MDNWFDRLAKGMAGTLSRREAMRRAGGVAGGLMAAMGLRRPAEAQGADDCVRFCKSSSIGDRAKCLKLCRECDRDPRRVCPDPTGTELICCPEGSFCVNKRCCRREQICLNENGERFCCPAGTICRNDRCVCPDLRPFCITPTGDRRCCPPDTDCD